MRLFKKLKQKWYDSLLNRFTHNCSKHQKNLIPEENSGFESYCTKCGEPN